MQIERIIGKHTNLKPVRVGSIARDLGLDVKKGTLEAGMVGQLMWQNDIYKIRVNRHLPLKLQRYVVAHECAHFVLHRSLLHASLHHWILDDAFFRSPFIPIEVEEEAHQWAMDVLMPLALLEAELKEEGNLDEKALTELADSFGVATGRLQARLIRMGAAGRVSA